MALLASLNFKTIRLGSCLYEQWLKEKTLFDEQLNAGWPASEEVLSPEVSAGDFLDHLLDLHRRMCRVCRPSALLCSHADLPVQQPMDLRSLVTQQSPSIQHSTHQFIETRSSAIRQSPSVQYSSQQTLETRTQHSPSIRHATHQPMITRTWKSPTGTRSPATQRSPSIQYATQQPTEIRSPATQQSPNIQSATQQPTETRSPATQRSPSIQHATQQPSGNRSPATQQLLSIKQAAHQLVEATSLATQHSPSTCIQHSAQQTTDIRSPLTGHSPHSHPSSTGEIPHISGEDNAAESDNDNMPVRNGGADRMETSPTTDVNGDDPIAAEGAVKYETTCTWDPDEETKEKSCRIEQTQSRAVLPETGRSCADPWSVHRSSDSLDTILRSELEKSPVESESCGNQDLREGQSPAEQDGLVNQQSFLCWDCGQRFTHMERLQQHCDQGNCHHQRALLSTCHGDTADAANGREDTASSWSSHSETFQDNQDPSGQQKSNSDLHSCRLHCKFCDKIFTHKSSLNIHMRTHSPMESHSCDMCNRSFTQKETLVRHKLVHSSDNFTCLTCKKKFKYRNTLYVHVMTEHNGTRYASGIQSICRKEHFEHGVSNTTEASNVDVSEHPPVHTENLSEGCIPSETFAEQNFHQTRTGSQMEGLAAMSQGQPLEQSLLLGEFSRTLERKMQQYVCEFCNRVFSQSNNLKRHRRIHTKEKPYKCDVCLRGFAQSNTLKEHRHIHSNQKEYSCSACGKRFRQRSSVDKHKKINTTHGIVDCSLCGEKFAHKCRLRLHMASHMAFRP